MQKIKSGVTVLLMAFFSFLLISGCGDKDKKKGENSYTAKCNKVHEKYATCLEKAGPNDPSAIQSCQTSYQKDMVEAAESLTEEQRKSIGESMLETKLSEFTEVSEECVSKTTANEQFTCALKNVVSFSKEKFCSAP